MIGGLGRDDCVTLLGRNEDASWGKIVYQNQTGWISLTYLSVEGDIQQVAVAGPNGEAGSAAQDSQVLTTATLAPTQAASGMPRIIQVDAVSDSEGLRSRAYTFEYGCLDYTLQLPLKQAYAEAYAARDKAFYYSGQLPEDWEAQYYKKFLQGEYDQPLISSTVRTLREALDIQDDDNLVLALVSLVQHIEYDCDKLFSYETLEDHDYQTNFPYETLFVQKGVCGDFSILLGKMLQQANFGAAFLIYDKANHMAVGVRCPVGTANVINQGVGYCYIETTAPSRIGVKPRNINGNAFTEQAKVIPIAEGKSFVRMNAIRAAQAAEAERYGDIVLQLAGCEVISHYKEIKDQEAQLRDYETQLNQHADRLETASSRLESRISEYDAMGCEGEVSQDKYQSCMEKLNEIQAERRSYTNLVEKYKDLYDDYQAFYQGYTLDFRAFEALMGENYSSCSTVSREEISLQEESQE